MLFWILVVILIVGATWRIVQGSSSLSPTGLPSGSPTVGSSVSPLGAQGRYYLKNQDGNYLSANPIGWSSTPTTVFIASRITGTSSTFELEASPKTYLANAGACAPDGTGKTSFYNYIGTNPSISTTPIVWNLRSVSGSAAAFGTTTSPIQSLRNTLCSDGYLLLDPSNTSSAESQITLVQA